ncbi:MAG: prephenate dehydratase [Pseudoflavonifractor sp.]|nr:prephenate dehydratase [Alloprevotella sp.]MCM1117116.1 prephenate dehydratase [Pseudoflavonifractor sp.]
MSRKVTIQGVAGCFHDAAARAYFGNEEIETVECDSFPQMMERLDRDASLVGIMAIENTIAGALLQNHELLRRGGHTIVGEIKMRISHVLCALPGQSIDTLDEVGSHPMALMQCEVFLRQHPNLRLTETFDTAGTAREIAAGRQRPTMGAVCGELAAQLYGLDILERGIETNKRNFTRFLILADPLAAPELRPRPEECNKASIVFTLPHSNGSLSKVLTILSFYDISLTKIQSMPIIGREWEYRFYADLTYDSAVRYRQAIDAILPLINDFRSLGEYKACTNEIF